VYYALANPGKHVSTAPTPISALVEIRSQIGPAERPALCKVKQIILMDFIPLYCDKMVLLIYCHQTQQIY